MTRLATFAESLPSLLGDGLKSVAIHHGEITCEIAAERVIESCEILRDHESAKFEILIDLCGVDYSTYGEGGGTAWPDTGFAVVYHLLSITHNRRIRLRAALDEHQPNIESVIDVWAAANWFEREAFDLYGIIFRGHPDLRRLLTDYGFIGHPFRKDFPLSGNVEMKYDEELRRVVYQAATVEPRILVPRTISKDVFTSATPPAKDADDG